MSVQLSWREYVSAFRNVARQVRRSLFGMAAVAFGVVALLLSMGFIEWIFWATREGTIQAGLGHVHVVKKGYLAGGHADPFDYLLPQEAALPEALRNTPGVHTIAPRLAFTGLISRGEATLSFIGEGVDPEAERYLSRTLAIPAGENLSPDDAHGIILGRGLADNLGVNVGDSVVLLANLPGGGINAVECHVRGVFSTVSKAYDDSALRVPLPVAQKLLRASGVHRWIIVLDDTAYTQKITPVLQTGFGHLGVEFVPWYQLADFYNKVVDLLSRQMSVVQLMIGVIIVLSISNTMMMNVLERTAEVGTSMALGRRRRHILRQFVYEGLTIGLIGGAAGLLAGWTLAMVISHIGIPMPPPPGMAEGYTGEILVTGPVVVSAVLLALGTTLLASLYPAWKASRLQIVDALRHNR